MKRAIPTIISAFLAFLGSLSAALEVDAIATVFEATKEINAGGGGGMGWGNPSVSKNKPSSGV